MDLELAGRKALVLGASQGLGLAIARNLAAEGAQVILAARNGAKLDAAVAGIRAAGGNADSLVVDLADPASIAAAMESPLVAGTGILVLNGGGPAAGAVAAAAPDAWTAGFGNMVAGPVSIATALLPGMRERGWGRVLCILSSGVVQPIPNLGLSNSLRAAVAGWAKTLAAEVAGDGITVNCIIPGRIHTERVDQLDAVAAGRQSRTVEEIAAASRATIPLGRYGRPEEFADAACFLVSARASYITGSMLRVDGGMIRGL